MVYEGNIPPTHTHMHTHTYIHTNLLAFIRKKYDVMMYEGNIFFCQHCLFIHMCIGLLEERLPLLT